MDDGKRLQRIGLDDLNSNRVAKGDEKRRSPSFSREKRSATGNSGDGFPGIGKRGRNLGANLFTKCDGFGKRKIERRESSASVEGLAEGEEEVMELPGAKKRKMDDGKRIERSGLDDSDLNRIAKVEVKRRSASFRREKGSAIDNFCDESKGIGKRLRDSGPDDCFSERKIWRRDTLASVEGLAKVKSIKNKRQGSLMCHQCQRNDKSRVVFCSACNRKHYCYECIAKWYPERTRDDFENACPFCCGNCNCKACLRENWVMKSNHTEVDASAKPMWLQYLLYKCLPVLRHIYQEQSSELEVEGVQLTDGEVTRIKLEKNVYTVTIATLLL
ncbi:hypothetical protein Nepgr_002246 [Nepenthes gracilis]|uniref:RING-type domain-containing protein n=1 Tax=Nepenthes gracilis TaxID=150966 RepID=A0AAD3RWQ0_NEPGR|nr:hypothetical protein Nepgr_002246 [Nepenthes gracilis]